MSKFIHIGINFYDRPTKIKELMPAFDLALSWARYAPNNWIVWTPADAPTWYVRLKPYLHDDDSILIGEINMTTNSGYLPKFIWEWAAKIKEGQSPAQFLPSLGQPHFGLPPPAPKNPFDKS